MEEAPENGKESSHSARANGKNEWMLRTAKKLFCNELYFKKQSWGQAVIAVILTYLLHGAESFLRS